MPKSVTTYAKPLLHQDCIVAAKFWLDHCNGSKKEAMQLLKYPYDFLEDSEDIKVLQTVLALES